MNTCKTEISVPPFNNNILYTKRLISLIFVRLCLMMAFWKEPKHVAFFFWTSYWLKMYL